MYMSVCIETRSLSVENTEGLKILDDVSIDISCGDFVIVSGPSGGGKSTLLKIFIGIVEAFRNLKVSGYVRVLDVDVLKEGFRKLLGKVGIVFQNPINEIFSLTVEEEIAFPLENMNLEPIEISKRIDRALHIVNIENLRNRLVHELSMGQIQRVVLASVIAMEPQILLLDEPCAYMDPGSKRRFYEYVYSYWRNNNVTVIVVEHDLDYVLGYATKLLILNRRVVAYGNPIDVLNRVRVEDYGIKEPIYIKMCRGFEKSAKSVEEAIDCLKKFICRDRK